eukprot:1468172-Prymnesium_polylepis.1
MWRRFLRVAAETVLAGRTATAYITPRLTSHRRIVTTPVSALAPPGEERRTEKCEERPGPAAWSSPG